MLSGYVSSGFGKAGFQLLQETYSVSLKGDSSAYGELWSTLIEQTSRSRNKNELSIRSAFPVYPDEPIAVEVISDAGPPVLRYQSQQLSVSENALIDDVWESKLWADRAGWQTISTGDSIQQNFYVSEKGSWDALAAANRIKINQLKSRSTDHRIFTSPGSRAISKWIFYALFLISAGALWIVPKL